MALLGDNRSRTDDLMRAKHAFYQLNYIPWMASWVDGFFKKGQ